VRFLVDAALMAHDPVNFHPLTNTGTTAVSREDFEAFVRATGHGFEVIDFTQLLTEAE
jgi:Ala-tRNA(Pro) deacylase